MLHLDLKEDNLFYPACSENELGLDGTFCVLLDCGSSREIGSIKAYDYISSTFGYDPPEVRAINEPPPDVSPKWVQDYCDEVNIWSDLYSLGVIAFKLIMGSDIDSKTFRSTIYDENSERKANSIRENITKHLYNNYPYLCKKISDVLIKLIYAKAKVDSAKSSESERYESCEELDKDLTQVLEIIENNGYHPEVLAQQCRDQYKSILLNNNITDEKYFDFNETPFVEKWFAGVSEA
jgi:Protein kinase domain.